MTSSVLDSDTSDDTAVRSLSSAKLSMKYFNCLGGLAALVNDIHRIMHCSGSHMEKLEKAQAVLRQAYRVKSNSQAINLFFRERKQVFGTDGKGVVGKEPRNVAVVADLLFDLASKDNLSIIFDNSLDGSEGDEDRSRYLSHSLRSASVQSRLSHIHVRSHMANDSVSTVIVDGSTHDDDHVPILRPFKQVYSQQEVESEQEVKRLQDKMKQMEQRHIEELAEETQKRKVAEQEKEKLRDKIERMKSSYDDMKQRTAADHHLREDLGNAIRSRDDAFLRLSQADQIHSDLKVMYGEIESALAETSFREREALEINRRLEDELHLSVEENAEFVNKYNSLNIDRQRLLEEVEMLKKQLLREKQKPVAVAKSPPSKGSEDPESQLHEAVRILHLEIEKLKKKVADAEAKTLRMSNEKTKMHLSLQERRKQCSEHTCPGSAGAAYKVGVLEDEIKKISMENNRLRMKINDMIEHPDTVVLTIKETTVRTAVTA